MHLSTHTHNDTTMHKRDMNKQTWKHEEEIHFWTNTIAKIFVLLGGRDRPKKESAITRIKMKKKCQMKKEDKWNDRLVATEL